MSLWYRYFSTGGPPEKVVQLLSENYQAVAQTINIMAEWLIHSGQFPAEGESGCSGIQTDTEQTHTKTYTHDVMYTHVHAHTCSAHAHAPPPPMHLYRHKHTHTCTCTHLCMYTHVCTCTHTPHPMQIFRHKHMVTCTHTPHTHARMHAPPPHTHTHTQPVAIPCLSSLSFPLALAGVKVSEVQDTVENHLKEMILKHFDPKKADSIFTDGGVSYVEDMCKLCRRGGMVVVVVGGGGGVSGRV